VEGRVRPAGTGALVVLLSAGCLSRQTAEQHDIGPVDSQPERGSLACAPGSAQAIALLEPATTTTDCGTVLERDETGELSVVRRRRVDEFELPDVLARGLAPEACGDQLEHCELSGVTDTLGPLVLARVSGPESEMPIQVYIGWVEGERLLFVETWYGLPSVVDHTRVGPPWALAAFECAGERMLLPARRLPEADHELPPATLRALAGRWRIDADGIPQPPEQPATIDSSTCRALLRELP
jgi:hypothetical protein